MRSVDFGRYALSSCFAAAMLAGCSGSQSPIAASSAVTAQSRSIAPPAASADLPARGAYVQTIRGTFS